MFFSNLSRKNMNFFLDHIDKYIQYPTPTEQIQQDIILGKIYKDMYNSDIFVTNLIKRHQLLKKTRFIHKTKDIPSSTLLDSKYISVSIRDYIEKNSVMYLHYTCTIFNKIINIYIVLFKKIPDSNISYYDEMVSKMLIWLRIAFLYSPTYCGKDLKVILYLTHFKKELPLKTIDILGAEHCNSAVTTTCSAKGDIIIYRKEEWFKVFIHETFHALGLDFSTFSCSNIHYKLSQLFPINSEYNVYEAYAEFWATIINCLFCAYELLDDKLDEKDFLLYSDFCIQFERIFSLFQLVKILHFMGISYKDLYENSSVSQIARKYLYKEKTNVFSYYIIKNLLLYHYSSFLKWCNNNNINTLRFDKYDNNLNKFYTFIQQRYKDNEYLNDIKSMRLHFGLKKKNKKKIYDTMRMTLCEWE